MGHNQQQQQEEKEVADLVMTVMEHQREEGYDDPNEEAERHARMRALGRRIRDG